MAGLKLSIDARFVQHRANASLPPSISERLYPRNELVDSALWFGCDSIRIVIARITSLSARVIVAGLDDARFVSDRANASLPQA